MALLNSPFRWSLAPLDVCSWRGAGKALLNCWILLCIAPELYHTDYLYWLIIAFLLFRLVANMPHVLHLAVAEGLARNQSTALDHEALQE